MQARELTHDLTQWGRDAPLAKLLAKDIMHILDDPEADSQFFELQCYIGTCSGWTGMNHRRQRSLHDEKRLEYALGGRWEESKREKCLPSLLRGKASGIVDSFPSSSPTTILALELRAWNGESNPAVDVACCFQRPTSLGIVNSSPAEAAEFDQRVEDFRAACEALEVAHAELMARQQDVEN